MSTEGDILRFADDLDRAERAEKINEQRAERVKRDWETVLSTPSGRRVLWQLLAAAGYGQPVMSTDAQTTAYNCGRQALELFLRERIEVAKPEALLQMRREYESELKSQLNELNKQEE